MSTIDTKVSGRRLGRIIGELDDIALRVNTMSRGESEVGFTSESLDRLELVILSALAIAESVTAVVNAQQGTSRR